MDIPRASAAVATVHQEFSKILANERCRTCACMHADMLAGILATVRELQEVSTDTRLESAQRDLERWMEDARHADLHG